MFVNQSLTGSWPRNTDLIETLELENLINQVGWLIPMGQVLDNPF